MKCDVTFVNFPVSDSIRSIVASKIEERVRKFSHKFAMARAFFSVDGHLHQVRLSVSGADVSMVVSASSADLGHSVDQAIDKLETSLRKMAAKRCDRRFDEPIAPLDMSSKNAMKHIRKARRRHETTFENAFDKYEEEFAREVEDNLQLVG